MGCIDINVKCDDKGHDHGGHGGHKDKDKGCCGPCDGMHGAPSFVAGADVGNITPVATELPASLLVNPVGSGKTLVITSRLMTSIGSDDAGILFRYYFGPTVAAAGAPAPITNLAPGPMAASSVAQFTSVPTVAPLGALVDAFNVSGDHGSSDVKLTLGEGQSLLVTQRANAENTRATASIYWTECRNRHHDEQPMATPG
jgi:hypothetical protein